MIDDDRLARAWRHFAKTGAVDVNQVTPPIAHSWRRCAAQRPTGDPATRHQPSIEMLALLPLMRPILEDLAQFIEGSASLVAIADINTVVVEVLGEPARRAELESIGFVAGANWSEDRRGTNALSLALIEAMPVQVIGEGHFRAELHPFYATAAPIFDGMGLPIGTIAVLGPRQDCHPHSLGLVYAAAQAINNQLQTNLWLTNAQNRLTELNSILQTLSEGVILLGRDGMVSQMNARAAQLLGLSTMHAMGRRLRDLLEVPLPLEEALSQGFELYDEEIVFTIQGKRVACVCTLRQIRAPVYPVSLVDSAFQFGTKGVIVSPTPRGEGAQVLSLRGIERIQRLVQKISGARARITFDKIAGASDALGEALRLARIAATSQVTVLLRGETGTGKELFAQSIHNASDRARGPFIAINCAAIPRDLITSELFGYEGGAFTGADRQGRAGKFELAHGGTLFLDEIGDMPRELQTTLLRALETRTITRIGGQDVINVDVRIIAATHKSLEDDVASGAFRSDLFYRLNVFMITIPPLRQRREDIPAIIGVIPRRHSATLGQPIQVTAAALEALRAYDWPGNVRELENTLERAAYIANHHVIDLADLPPSLQRPAPVTAPPPVAVAPPDELKSLKTERASHDAALIEQAIVAADGNLTRAAEMLGISRTTLWRRRAQAQEPETGAAVAE